MKSIKYQQFRASTPSSPKGPRTLNSCREANIFQNYDLPILSDRFLLNTSKNSKISSNSPRKNRILSQVQAEAAPNIKQQKRERSLSNQAKQIYQETQGRSLSNSNYYAQTSPNSERNEISLPLRMVQDNKCYNSSIVYGYSSFHSSLKQKKKSVQKQNYLNDYFEIKQIELLQKLKQHESHKKQKEINNSHEQTQCNKNKGFFEISIFNYSNLNRGELDNIINHKQVNYRQIK
ncbi:hypothetical protein TTHERM_00999150 (macronuclear) [Tetrahymena thermophila SB210]|uniref:Uncharacterized protein n=1 Tax=Tetrahymena thermophila (strain SB210) TaxID=312017 RepID=Q22D62_TETTS|nr:hypothetical protein TTHERM_00999150 [Tetrahymena thermophila SB210]EAR83263.1 hypothetical protein TTHERM_00999150 [Tetrahymena thermophila SB210]|eukprot:XP_001030926.1 hypothetical protein TTHERM_00999150 [Tetrahymena thermophila SB210]